MTETQRRDEALKPFNANMHSQFLRVASIGIRLYTPGDRKSPRGYQADLVDTTSRNSHVKVTLAKNPRIDNVIGDFKGLPESFRHTGVLVSFIKHTQVADDSVLQVTKEFIFSRFGDAKRIVRATPEEKPDLVALTAQDYDKLFTAIKRINTGEVAKNN